MQIKSFFTWLVVYALLILLQILIWQTMTEGEFLTRPLPNLIFFFFNGLWIPLTMSFKLNSYKPWFRWVIDRLRMQNHPLPAELQKPYQWIALLTGMLAIALMVVQVAWVYTDKSVWIRLVYAVFSLVGGFALAWELTRLVWPRVQSPLEKMG